MKSSDGEQENDGPEQQQPKRQRTEQVHNEAVPRAHQQAALGGEQEEGPSGSRGEDEGGRGSGRGPSGDKGRHERAAGRKGGKGSRPDRPQGAPDGGGGGSGGGRGKAAVPKKPSQLHRLAMKVAEEKEAAQRAKEEVRP